MKYRVMHVLGAVDGSATGVQSFIKNHIQVEDEEFEYMVAESNGDAHFPFNQYLDGIGIERIVFPELKISKVFDYFRECREFYKTNTIDILHVDNPITAFIHNYYAKKNGVPVFRYLGKNYSKSIISFFSIKKCNASNFLWTISWRENFWK